MGGVGSPPGSVVVVVAPGPVVEAVVGVLALVDDVVTAPAAAGSTPTATKAATNTQRARVSPNITLPVGIWAPDLQV